MPNTLELALDQQVPGSSSGRRTIKISCLFANQFQLTKTSISQLDS